jgi:ketosteroid isomerase-like protein
VAFATLVFRAIPSGGHVHESNGDVERSLAGRAQPPGDSVAAAAAVHKFHEALAVGDSAGALALLTSDVIILESGGVETREEYRSHHLPGDMAFARAVKSDRSPLRVMVRGDVAWVTGTSATAGEYRGRQVNSAGAELVVLTRTSAGWRISAIHWSSRARRATGG